MIFSHLPDDLFNIFAGQAKHIYSNVLLDLFDHYFSDETLITLPEKDEIVSRVSVFLKNIPDLNNTLDETHDDRKSSVKIIDAPLRVYYRLRDCGWFVESRDGYRIIVDMPSEVVILLSALNQIKEGVSRNYNGTVLSILSSLSYAHDAPMERGAALAEAARQTKELVHHLRAMLSSLRKMEDEVIRKPDPANIFRHFFEDFFDDFILGQYKVLITKNNPWRYRSDIIAKTEEILASDITLSDLTKTFMETDTHTSEDAARRHVLNCLQNIRSAFEGIDPLRDAIDQFKYRVERRVVNTVRYMEKLNQADLYRLVTTIKSLSTCGDELDQIVSPLKVNLLRYQLPLSQFSLAKPRKKIERRKTGKRIKSPIDPSLKRYNEAKIAFKERLAPSPAKIEIYIRSQLEANQGSITADKLSIETLDDFVIFDALRRLKTKTTILKDREIKVVPIDENSVKSEWVECTNFEIVISEETDVK